jgi:hypothetical protein
MTQDKRKHGIITGTSYPEVLTKEDIEACKLETEAQTRICVKKFKKELNERKIAPQKAFDNAVEKSAIIQNKINDAQKAFDDYATKLTAAETNVTIANNDLAAATKKGEGHGIFARGYGSCWQGGSPEENAGCVQNHQNIVATKKAARDKVSANKIVAEQELNTAKAEQTELNGQKASHEVHINSLNSLNSNIEELFEQLLSGTIPGNDPCGDKVKPAGEPFVEL